MEENLKKNVDVTVIGGSLVVNADITVRRGYKLQPN